MNRAEQSAEHNQILDQPPFREVLDGFEEALFNGQNWEAFLCATGRIG